MNALLMNHPATIPKSATMYVHLYLLNSVSANTFISEGIFTIVETRMDGRGYSNIIVSEDESCRNAYVCQTCIIILPISIIVVH